VVRQYAEPATWRQSAGIEPSRFFAVNIAHMFDAATGQPDRHRPARTARIVEAGL